MTRIAKNKLYNWIRWEFPEEWGGGLFERIWGVIKDRSATSNRCL